MQFLVGNGILAFGIFFVVCLFLYLSFRTPVKAGDETAFKDMYAVELDPSLNGEYISVYINDSLLFDNKMDGISRSFKVKRFAEESALMVVDKQTDNIVPCNLDAEGCSVTVLKEENRFVIRKN